MGRVKHLDGAPIVLRVVPVRLERVVCFHSTWADVADAHPFATQKYSKKKVNKNREGGKLTSFSIHSHRGHLTRFCERAVSWVWPSRRSDVRHWL